MKVWASTLLLLKLCLQITHALVTGASLSVDRSVKYFIPKQTVSSTWSTATGCTMEEARTICQDQNADLALITSKDEIEMVKRILLKEANDRQAFWIGLQKNSVSFRWVDGAPLIVKNWKSGQPNQRFPNQKCVYARASAEGRWHDVSCNTRMHNGITRLPLCESVLFSGTREGSYFLPGNNLLGKNCWYGGCNYADSLEVCKEEKVTLAKIRNRHDNREIGRLLSHFHEHKSGVVRDFFWFYTGLKDVRGVYKWDDGSEAVFFNWGGDEPNNLVGSLENCTFVAPNVEGNTGSLTQYGPKWGDIGCDKSELSWTKGAVNNHVTMVPVCEEITQTASPSGTSDDKLPGLIGAYIGGAVGVVVLLVGAMIIALLVIWKKSKKDADAPVKREPYGEEHQYDYAFSEEHDQPNRRRQNQQVRSQDSVQGRVLQTMDNPYYGVDDNEVETNGKDKVMQGMKNTGYEGDRVKDGSDSDHCPASSNMVTVKVAENPYYAT